MSDELRLAVAALSSADREIVALQARVAVLTAALTGLLRRHDEGWATPGIWVNAWEGARAALAAGEEKSDA